MEGQTTIIKIKMKNTRIYYCNLLSKINYVLN